MKPYGLPRNHDVEFPDVADMHTYGLKASKGSIRGKGGDFRSYHKNAQSKANTRRYWKKRERRRAQKKAEEDLMSFYCEKDVGKVRSSKWCEVCGKSLKGGPAVTVPSECFETTTYLCKPCHKKLCDKGITDISKVHCEEEDEEFCCPECEDSQYGCASCTS